MTRGDSQNTGCGDSSHQLWGQAGLLLSLELAGKGEVLNLKLQLFEKSVPEPLSPRKGKVNPPVEMPGDTAPKYVVVIICET